MADEKNLAGGMTPQESLAAVRRLTQFAAVAREVDGNLPCQCLQVLLHISKTPGTTQAAIKAQCRLAQGSVSRNVKALSTKNRFGAAGLGLIAVVESRPQTMFLTAKGKAYVKRLLQAGTGRPADDFRPPTVR